ncbi:hypothetical protein [Oceanibaculum nanhaiense]|uniref:hypothetical protein n=1 Tax=Oceanibaculum nanhaiense TaxID=1909734 RepID=UPI00396DCFD5
MTTRTIEDFAARLDADQALAGQFVACLQAAPEGGTVTAAVGFAVANGFSATPDEMELYLTAVFQRSQELSDGALDKVSGGLPVFVTSPGGWNRTGLWTYR